MTVYDYKEKNAVDCEKRRVTRHITQYTHYSNITEVAILQNLTVCQLFLTKKSFLKNLLFEVLPYISTLLDVGLGSVL